MIRLFWVKKTGWIFKAIQVIGSVLLIAIGAIQKTEIDPSQHPELAVLKPGVDFGKEWATYLIPGITILVGSATYFKSHFGTDKTWSTVTTLLEEYKRGIFEKKENFDQDPDYYNRVTLYRYVSWRWSLCRWPFTGWMVPVARTGHTTVSRHIRRFRASKSNPDSAEGVAGQTYVQWVTLPVFDLLEITAASSNDDRRLYAKKGLIPESWVLKRSNRLLDLRPVRWLTERFLKRPTFTSRSLLGVPIEVNGNRWGVLVIDSRKPEKIGETELLQTTHFKTLAKVLGKILER
jgi:hypothetical protein